MQKVGIRVQGIHGSPLGTLRNNKDDLKRDRGPASKGKDRAYKRNTTLIGTFP